MATAPTARTKSQAVDRAPRASGRVADDDSGGDDLGNLVDRTPDDESLPARAEVE